MTPFPFSTNIETLPEPRRLWAFNRVGLDDCQLIQGSSGSWARAFPESGTKKLCASDSSSIGLDCGRQTGALPWAPATADSASSNVNVYGDSIFVRTCPFEHAGGKSSRTLHSHRPEARGFRAFSCFQLCSADSDLLCWLWARLNAVRAERVSALGLSSLPTVCGIRGRCPAGSGAPESQSDGP
jgi:hypothetical protein